MVDQLDTASKETKYKNGRVYSLTTQASQGGYIRVELSKRQQTSFGTRTELRLKGGLRNIARGVGRYFCCYR